MAFYYGGMGGRDRNRQGIQGEYLIHEKVMWEKSALEEEGGVFGGHKLM